MTITAVENVVEGSRLRRTNKGFEDTRVFVVEGLTNGADVTVAAQILDSGVVPVYGELHPDIDTIVVLTIDSKIEKPGIVRLTFAYGDPSWFDLADPDDLDQDSVEIDITAALVQQSTQKDATGADLEVAYETIEQVATVSVGRPQTVLSFARVEETYASSKARTYVGKVNLGVFQGAAEKTMLCQSISSKKIATDRYNVLYSFLYDPNTHQTDIWFIDQNTGRPPADLVADTGKKTVDVYEAVNFAPLNLPSI